MGSENVGRKRELCPDQERTNGEVISSEELQEWLRRQFAERLEMDPERIDVHERFSRYGLDSARALGLVNELSNQLERPLLPTVVWDHPTIASLTRYLLEGDEQPEQTAPQAAAVGGDQPIAIVGMACRFPSAPDLECYWRLLRDGVDAIREVPDDRWDIDALFDPEPRASGKMSTRWGGFLDRIDRFDAQFWGISPREAEQIDPQQRLMLELAWEALEDAGIPPLGLRGSRTGVFAGVMWSDYAKLTRSRLDGITEHTATGQDTSIVSARVSYSLGLEGPSLSIDTACSSSLVAVYLACQSLRNGDADLALAGGVHLVASPYSTVSMTKFGAMAPDGKSKAFDHRANGYVRGEGGGLIVLKPLAQAVADGDPIYAVLRGGAINNDGFSNGLTAPNPKAQEAMLRDAYDRLGIERRAVHYVETHGTGTMLGDPIEAGALGRVLGSGRDAERPLRIGSVKTNFGHTEAAAGIAGLIKVVLAMHHRQLPPSLHFEKPNPHIPFERWGLRVQTELEPWPECEVRALAGVSSFGFGGTNCHLVVEEAVAPRAQILTIAAPSEARLAEIARRVRQWLEGGESDRRLTLDAVAQAVSRSFAEGTHRLAIAAASLSELEAGLDAFLAGEERPGVVSGTAAATCGGAVFVASGQGSEWAGMARELLLEEPVFRRMMRRCDELLRSLAGWSLLEEIHAEEPRILQTEINQPMILAIQLSLAELWRSWGVEPTAVVGHSSGEMATAYLCGALDLERALEVAIHRGRATQKTCGQGKMAVLDLPPGEARKLIEGYEDRLAVAVVNSNSASVVSGQTAALEEVVGKLRESGEEIHYVKVEYPSHSPVMEPVLGELGEALADLAPAPLSLRAVSTLTADWVEQGAFDASYWQRNLRRTVRFAEAFKVLLDSGLDTFIELSAHPVLVKPMRQSLEDHGGEGVALPSLRRGGEERLSMLESLAVLFTRGHEVNFPAVFGRVDRLELPDELRELVADPGRIEDETPELVSRSQVYVLSARSESALRAAAESHAAAIAASDEALVDLAYTAATRRTHLEHRLALVAVDRRQLVDRLRAFADGSRAGVAVGCKRTSLRGIPVFVFSGQGSQWAGMGQGLLREPVCGETLRRIDARFQALSGESLVAELERPAESSRLAETAIAQPAIFALQVALAELWRSWGVEPIAVVGHSVGEIAAAHVAGVLSLDEAVELVYHRSRLMQRQSELGGRMVQLELDEAETNTLLEAHPELSLAAINGPRACVVAGPEAAIEACLEEVEARGIGHRRLRVEYAFHSLQMAPILDELRSSLAHLEPRKARLLLVSSVTGEAVEGPEMDADYWSRNVRQSVRFAPAIDHLASTGHDVFVELAPHPVLAASIKEGFAARQESCEVVPSLRREVDDRLTFLEAAGRLHVLGLPIDWPSLFPSGGQHVQLPLYPWQRERYWLPEAGDEPRPVEHPLLGERFDLSTSEPQVVWQHRIAGLRYLEDHRIRALVVMPGAAYLEMALSAGDRDLEGEGAPVLSAVEFENALLLSPEESAEGAPRLQLLLQAEDGAKGRFHLSSRRDHGGKNAWTLHARGRLERRPAPPPGDLDLEPVKTRCTAHLPAAEHYRNMSARGLEYGPAFRVVEELWRRDGEAVGRLSLRPDERSEAASYRVHPALLDGALQAFVAALPVAAGTSTYLPAGVDELTLWRRSPSSGAAWVWVRLEPASEGAERLRGEIELIDEDGRPWLSARGATFERVGSDGDRAARPFWQLEWRPAPIGEAAPDSRPPADTWLILVDGWGVGERLARQLSADGARVVRARHGVEYAALDGDTFTLRPDRADDFRRLLKAVLGDAPPEEIGRCSAVHLWSLDAEVATDGSSAAVLQAEQLGVLSALHLTQALLAVEDRIEPAGTWLVTAGAQPVGGAAVVSWAGSSLWGYGRTLGLEQPGLRCRRVDLPAGGGGAAALLREIYAGGEEDEVAWRDERRWAARLVRRDADELAGEVPTMPASCRAFRLEAPRPGRLENLAYHAFTRRSPGPGEVEIEVRAAGLNFRDVMKALDIYPGLPEGGIPLGDECAGVVTALGEGVEGLQPGDEVIALADRCFASHVVARSELVVRKPATLSFESAAAQLLTYLTAHYAFSRLARLEAGEKVLIHAAAGGVGMAAVRLAQRLGAEVFATAGSAEKRDLLRRAGVEHVMDSRSLEFAEEILQLTDGAGVDVVLNSLSGEFLPASLSVLAPYGRFIEIGKRDIYANRELGLEPFKNNLTYSALDLDLVMRQRPALARQVLDELMGWLEAGDLEPLPHRLFAAADAVEAFHFMAQAKHVGKVVLSYDQAAELEIAPQLGQVCRGDATYLVTGGFGDLGLATAEWLVAEGARSLALVGRRGARAEAAATLARLRAGGVWIRELRADVSKPEEVDRIFDELAQEPPLAGVVHAAGVLDDGTLEQLDGERFERVWAPKVLGAWNLHRRLADRPLDFFLMYSSVTGVLGSPGQANYAAANAALDGLASFRRGLGLSAQSIAWGPWSGIGMAARSALRGDRMASRGLAALTPETALAALGETIYGPAWLIVAGLDPELWRQANPSAARGSQLADFSAEDGAAAGERESSIGERFAALEASERGPAITGYLRQRVAEVLRLEPSRIGLQTPLRTLGLDSLMTVELRNVLEDDLGLSLPSSLAWNYPTVALMVPYLAERLGLSLEAAGAESGADGGPDAGLEAEIEEGVEALSDAEAERQLLAELDALSLP